MLKTTRSTQLIILLSLALAGWMIFDGTRKLVTGLYTGEDSLGLGPWARVVAVVGIEPDEMAVFFLLLGGVWVVNSVILMVRGEYRYERVIAVSALTLFYVFPGTVVSTVTLLLAVRERRRLSNQFENGLGKIA